MKTKTFAKKLSFSKQTIASLDIKEMQCANAGLFPSDNDTCPNWPGCPMKNVVNDFTLDCI